VDGGATPAFLVNTGAAKLMAHDVPWNAQLGTDLAQRPALGVQVCTLNIHRATVTANLSREVEIWR
jgi:hypothetical protein